MVVLSAQSNVLVQRFQTLDSKDPKDDGPCDVVRILLLIELLLLLLVLLPLPLPITMITITIRFW